VKFFQCPSCRHPVSFEHVACTNCSTELAFDSSRIEMTKLASHQSCRNREIIGCNWCVEGADWYCGSCRLTRTIPNLGSTRNIMLWRRMEGRYSPVVATRDAFYFTGYNTLRRLRSRNHPAGLFLRSDGSVIARGGHAVGRR